MAKAVATFEAHSMDFSSRIQLAQSESGKVFERIQVRDQRYGYKWTKWRATSAAAIEGKSSEGARNWRLPA